MQSSISELMFLGVWLTILCFWIAKRISKRLKWTICNPILVASVLVICFLAIFRIEVGEYERSADILTKILTPATISLAVPMYRQLELLKKHLFAIVVSILSGIMAGVCTIAIVARCFFLSEELTLSLMPKSITTAIAMGVSEEIGGNPTLTVGIVVFTGILGAIILKSVCKICSITHPVSIGLACGNAAHAVGTTKALEIGEIEGAMSSLAMVVAGLMTVLLVPIMVKFML